jgi:tyrosine-protein phosphatase SIW14
MSPQKTHAPTHRRRSRALIFTFALLWSQTSLVACAHTPVVQDSAREISFQTESPQSLPVIDRFHQVAPGIFRGARPGKQGVQELARLGFKTDLNLDSDDDEAELERGWAHDQGLQFIDERLSGFWRPNATQVRRILEFVKNPSNHPIFIHCKHGRDRTGLIVALHRVFHENWTPEQAYDEWRAMGYRPILFLLEDFYWDLTRP